MILTTEDTEGAVEKQDEENQAVMGVIVMDI